MKTFKLLKEKLYYKVSKGKAYVRRFNRENFIDFKEKLTFNLEPFGRKQYLDKNEK